MNGAITNAAIANIGAGRIIATRCPIDDWKKALLDLKDFIGHYHIEFAGGEPYIKKGFVDLITFCGEQGLKWGVTTNGAAFGNEKVADWTVAAQAFQHQHLDRLARRQNHDYSRGIDGSLSDIVAGIGNVARARRKSTARIFPSSSRPSCTS